MRIPPQPMPHTVRIHLPVLVWLQVHSQIDQRALQHSHAESMHIRQGGPGETPGNARAVHLSHVLIHSLLSSREASVNRPCSADIRAGAPHLQGTSRRDGWVHIVSNSAHVSVRCGQSRCDICSGTTSRCAPQAHPPEVTPTSLTFTPQNLQLMMGLSAAQAIPVRTTQALCAGGVF